LNNLKYLDNAYSKTGTLFKNTTLESTLKYCLTLPINGKKGQYGSIFVYNSDALGEHLDNEESTGIILLDIDNITKEIAETIYNSFSKLCEYWNCLLAIQYSSSYYIAKKAGLHVYVKSNSLDKFEYNQQSQICLGIFAQLVEKYLDIDLLSMNTKEKPVLDFHNTNLYQRINLFYSTFLYNEYAFEFDLDIISVDDLAKLQVKYNLKLDREIKKTIAPTLNNVIIGNGHKMKIDRNLHIGQYSGNDIRFRISIIADKVFGDNAKSFCDKFFYYENNKSIYTHYPSGNTINPLIYKWLVENKYIYKNSLNIINNWISEYSDEIVKSILRNRHLEIVAPTGSGKTTFINTYLAKKLNAIVIVPFNVTNKLYDELFEVNSMYNGEIPKSSPVVMIWDQAIRRWHEIKDRHIIIDEAHTLFLDRAYRDSAIKLIMKLKEDDCHVTFITATPSGERTIFNDTKVLEYYKNRDGINLNINNTMNIEWSQYNYIKKCIDNNWYDRIVLLDDMTAKKIYERFVVEGYVDNIAYIRSDTKDSEDFKYLRDSELLNKKLTICTCIAFNGLNFKNENEKVLVVGSIKQGQTTASEIIQQIGRIRKSKVHAIYYYDASKEYMNNIDERHEKALEKFNMHIPDFVSIDYKYLDQNYINALKEIQEYLFEHSYIDNIINELGKTGYISGSVNDELKTNDKITMTLALKRKESNEMKDDIINGKFFETEYKDGYKNKWMKDINRLISNENFSGISIETFKEMFSKERKKKLIETSINNLYEIIRVLNIDDNYFNYVVNNKERYMSMLTDMIDKKKFLSNLKHMIEIKEKYKDKVYINDNCIMFSDIVKDIIDEEEKRLIKEKKDNSEKGKHGKEIEIDGVKYKTISEAAKKLNTSRSQIYRML